MINNGLPTSEQLAAWGVPSGPLDDPVEMVRSTRMKRWHAPDCRLMRGIRKVEKAALPLAGTLLCRSCQPAPGPDAAAYLRILRQLAALDELAAAVKPTWASVVKAEVALARQPLTLDVPDAAPAAFQQAARAYARRRAEVAEAVGKARADAPDPMALVSDDRIRQLFGDDSDAWSAAYELCRIARPRIAGRHDQSEERDLLEAATWAWVDGGAQKLKEVIAAVFTGVEVRNVAVLPRPALTPVGAHPDPHAWAQAELLEHAAGRTADWPDRLRAHAATVAAEGGTTLLCLPDWPLTNGLWRDVAHLAAYPVVARAVSVADRGHGEVVVVRVPKVVADHTLRLLARYDKVPPTEDVDDDATTADLEARADHMLRQVTVTASQRSDRPDEAVLAARLRGPRDEYPRNVWTPVAEDGPTLTAVSRRQLTAVAGRASRVGVLLEPPGVIDQHGIPALRDHLVEIYCGGHDRRVADDGSAFLVDEMALPVSRLVYVCLYDER